MATKKKAKVKKKKKVSKKKVVQKGIKKKAAAKRQPGKNGLKVKKDFIKPYLKTKSRGDLIEMLTHKWKEMSPNYAATVVQLARTDAGITGRAFSGEKKKKTTTAKTPKKEVKKSSVKKLEKKKASAAKPAAEPVSVSKKPKAVSKKPAPEPVEEDIVDEEVDDLFDDDELE